MPTSDPARRMVPASAAHAPFVLYVEGPRDRSILRAWAQRLIPERAPALFEGVVILGGRRPDRAIAHFRACGEGAQGVCVLDRDGCDTLPEPEPVEGLHFHTWGRRHIESYLLVPDAIRRALDASDSDRRIEALLEGALPPPEDVAGWRALDAKRLLGANGALARALGQPLPLARIARTTRASELHADVHAVFAHLQRAVRSAGRGGRTPRGLRRPPRVS